MPGLYRINRRTLLADLGRGAIAVAIFGFAACGGDDDEAEDAGDAGTTSAPSGSGSSAPSTGGETAEAVTYQRVDLDFVSAYVLVRGNEAAVVDTGVAGSAPKIEEGLTAAGLAWADVGHVILTHYHPDHAGSIGDVLTAATGATAYAGEADLARIQAPRPLVAVKDDDDVFGLRMIATPGHTAGHLSVFDPAGGLLVVGDALTNDGGLAGSTAQFTDDMDAANQSIKKLAGLDAETVLFGHGEPLEGGAAGQIRSLAESL
jgi:glyoxylase-like metal-dependent hydrolase (beta-lactamase superfamily II)